MSTLLLFLQALVAGWSVPVAAGSPPATATTLIYLVRHAEKADDSANPPLSPAGEVRAAELARLLGGAGITRVWSTDFIRTRETAAPIARTLGLSAELYDPRDLPVFAERLKASPGVHLVVGHSNTTPALVRVLGGEPGPPIPETEYDRLYLVVVSPDGVATSTLRFGARSTQ